MASRLFHVRAASYLGVSLLHAHWLHHTLGEPLMRQVQQQRWQLIAERSMLTLVPVTICESTETFGVFNASARHLLDDLGKRISLNSGKATETSYLNQRISVLVQRFNAVLLHDSFPAADCTDCTHFLIF